MNDLRDRPPLAFDLEHPNLVTLPGPDAERKDSLNASGSFSLEPFRHSAPETQPSPPDELATHIQRQLKALRKSPGFKLIAESALFLKAIQLDMDCPAPPRRHVHEQLSRLLRQKTGKPLDPDHVHITLKTQTHPSVDEQGQERYSQRFSLTGLALACLDPKHQQDLKNCVPTDAPLAPSLTTGTVFELITGTPWADHYRHTLDTFWRTHEATYRTLARLSFLDSLARQSARRKISRDGYYLTLDALGFAGFPTDLQSLESGARGQLAEVHMLSLNGRQVPCLFQVRSPNTSHCFIHAPGLSAAVIEYISDDPAYMAQRLLDALNASHLHRRWLSQHFNDDNLPLSVQSVPIMDDVFSHLTKAQQTFALDLLNNADEARMIDPFKPIARSLALAGAVDLWQTQPAILKHIPSPHRLAARLMGEALPDSSLNPDHVFIAYRRGTSITPLGSVHQPVSHVHVPSEKPVSLSEALINNYRVEYPAGYIDHGGRSVVYLDPTGKGDWADDRELPLSAQSIEDKIIAIDFLSLMSAHLDEFWEQQADTIEAAFRTLFMTQAVICLKQGSLLRSGFDRVVQSLTAPGARWLTLGFEVKSSFSEGIQALQCAGLLILEGAQKNHRVLYQPGLPQAFVEFQHDEGLQKYLRHATGKEQWRTAVLNYIPQRHQQRLDYLFKLWAGIQAPTPPASILRPWTDTLYNTDVRKALNHTFHEHPLSGSPFAFMRQTLKRNALEEARQQIVTSAQLSLRYWTEQLNHLQLLLAPMSLLLTPAWMVSLATEIGIASLNIASANLPGIRAEEKRQAMLSLLSLGLFNLAPYTPRLLGGLGKKAVPAGNAVRTGSGVFVRPLNQTARLRRSVNPRNTRLEKFFHTDSVLKVWTIPGLPLSGSLAIHAWKLGRKFLLWTSSRGQARTLVISTHGHYMPWSSTVKIPNGTEIQTFAPHGYVLIDPKLHRVVSGKIGPFARSDSFGNTLAIPPSSLPPLVLTDKLMAGTSLPGRLKNYTLSKFQTVSDETYQDIAHIVRNSNISPFKNQLPPTPMDVLTVRNRFAMNAPTLDDLFQTLFAQGIHYDRILLVHCRCAALDVLLHRAPEYQGIVLKPTLINAP
ncbi:dermonecrotic toxin domain-containing protein [Pseudomonas sp. NPDC089734]|uniref:dermonecrotic toxin domain-containing protein n=1 Tax=Pseudomonas sp. NPDC089734 TaxID=3364469 RepID=UPI0037F4BB48